MRKPQEILEVARRKWPSALRAEARGEDFFPLQIPLGPLARTDDFSIIREAIGSLTCDGHGFLVEWEEVKTRKWGTQRWPRRVTFGSISQLADALHLTRELHLFRNALMTARTECPELEPWLRAKAHRIPEFLDQWQGLLAVCACFKSNTKPQCYPRQLPVTVGTKFIEQNSGILRELLEVVLGDRINANGASFEERFHLLSEPPQVRFRFLDRGLRDLTQLPFMDCAATAEEFARLSWEIPRVLIVENRVVFLCLPDIPDTLAVLGNGKAASLLLSCDWMRKSDVVYWGDLDEAGFGILSSLRAGLPAIRSVLMDIETWNQWSEFAVPGKRDPTVQHNNLSVHEDQALKAIQKGPWMLEQERIPPNDSTRMIQEAFLPQ
jgi:hypothetical protein